MRYRVSSIDSLGRRLSQSMENLTLKGAQKRYGVVRDLYDEFVDVFIEGMDEPEWERIEPLQAVNQPELPI